MSIINYYFVKKLIYFMEILDHESHKKNFDSGHDKQKNSVDNDNFLKKSRDPFYVKEICEIFSDMVFKKFV